MKATSGAFPTRENCDPTNPEEAFLWMFAALPGSRGGQFIFPTIGYARLVSKHLWELGARPAEEPTKEYVSTTGDDPHWLTSPGKWVKAGSFSQADRERAEVRRGISVMGHQQKVALKKAIEVVEAGETPPDTAAGKVAATLNANQRKVVLETLHDPA